MLSSTLALLTRRNAVLHNYRQPGPDGIRDCAGLGCLRVILITAGLSTGLSGPIKSLLVRNAGIYGILLWRFQMCEGLKLGRVRN